MRKSKFYEKINYTIELVDKIEYFPLPKHQNSIFTHYFPDGTDVGSFISTQIKKLHNGLLTADEVIMLNKLLDMKKECRDIKFNIKINELADLVSSIGYIPYDLKLSNGQDVNDFLRYYKEKMLNQELSLPDMKTLEYFLDYYNNFNVKLREIDMAASEIGKLPVQNTKDSNSNYVRKFSDGTDVGSWVQGILNKISNGELKGEIADEFLNIYNRLRKRTFREKVKKTLSLAIDIGYIPYSSKTSQRKYKFSDGTYVGSFISNNRHYFINKKLDDEKYMLFKELMNFDFSKHENWISNYQGLKEYRKTHNSLKSASSNSKFSEFIYEQQERYYSTDNKNIVQEVFEEKLFELDPNWINYGRKGRKRKVKS